MTRFSRKFSSTSTGTARLSLPPAQIEQLECRRLMAGDVRLIDAALGADKTTVTVHYSVAGSFGFFPDTGISVEDNTRPDWTFPSAPGGSTDLNPDSDGQGTIFIGPATGEFTQDILIDPYTPRPGHSLLVVFDEGNEIAETDESNNVLLLSTAPGKIEKLDIQLKGLAAGFNGAISNIDFDYKVKPAIETGPFAVGLYYSADKVFDASDVFIRAETFSSAATADVQHGNFSLFPSSIVVDPNRPYILVVADPVNEIAETNEKNNVSAIPLPSVTVKVSGGPVIDGVPTFDLLKKAKLFPKLNVKLPAGMKVSSYSIDQRLETEKQWHTVAVIVDAAPPVLTQRLAGHIEYRATVTINGIDYTTLEGQETHVDVRFPRVEDIFKAKIVEHPGDTFTSPTTFTRFYTELWDANQFPRTQEGRWLYLDTATGIYSFTYAESQSLAPTDEQGLFDFGPTPQDIFAADRLSADYVVAVFRRHSSNRAIDPGLAPRSVGPTPGEIRLAGSFSEGSGDERPLIVLDYVGHVVKGVRLLDMVTTENAPFKLWTASVDRRPFAGK